jgi:hypothetical protein
MARVLSPEGKLIMNLPFYYWLHEQPYDYYRYTQFALKRFIERSGMRLLQLQETGGSPEVLADVFAKNAIHLPVIGTPIAMLTQWAVSTFTHTSLGRRISVATGRLFPLGYFLIAEKVG